MTIYLTEPWREHRFPHKRHVRKLSTARVTYRCDTHDNQRPPDCARTIHPGDRYLRVSLRLSRQKRDDSWRSVRLCSACAVHLGLATTTEPERFA